MQVELAVGEHVPEPALRHYDKKAHKLQQKHSFGEQKERIPSTEEHSVLAGHLPAALRPADCAANQDARVGEFSYYLTVSGGEMRHGRLGHQDRHQYQTLAPLCVCSQDRRLQCATDKSWAAASP